jgi:hypothetical protein
MPTFSRYLWLTVVLFVATSIAFAMYALSERQVDRANDLRYESFLLADEIVSASLTR